jgi:hypothetical protein
MQANYSLPHFKLETLKSPRKPLAETTPIDLELMVT